MDILIKKLINYEIINNEKFNIDEFINECRKQTSLENVLNELKKNSNSLDNELMELINKNYNEFIKLSSNLIGIDQVIQQIRNPLLEMKEEVKVIIIIFFF